MILLLASLQLGAWLSFILFSFNFEVQKLQSRVTNEIVYCSLFEHVYCLSLGYNYGVVPSLNVDVLTTLKKQNTMIYSLKLIFFNQLIISPMLVFLVCLNACFMTALSSCQVSQKCGMNSAKLLNPTSQKFSTHTF